LILRAGGSAVDAASRLAALAVVAVELRIGWDAFTELVWEAGCPTARANGPAGARVGGSCGVRDLG
jgi:hypothetical protein